MALTATGLTVPRLADIRTSMRAAISASPVLGPAWQTGPGSILGQIIDVVATQIADIYELAAAAYEAFDPDAAEGVQQDHIASIIGVVREPATYSTGTQTLTGTPATVVPAGTQYRVPAGPIVSQDAAATIGGGGTVDAACTAVEIGAVEIGATDCDEIVTAVPGLTSVSNAVAYSTGRDVETDAELRARRERKLVAPSSSTDYGIASALEELTDVTYARAISDRVAHTLHCLVYPNSADTDGVAATIWNTTPAGIELLGAQSATVEDAADCSQTVYWDWVSEQTIVVVVTMSGIDNTPANQGLVEDAILTELDRLGVGDDLYSVQLVGAVVEAMGDDVTSCTITVDGGSSVSIDEDEIAVTTAGNITVTIT